MLGARFSKAAAFATGPHAAALESRAPKIIFSTPVRLLPPYPSDTLMRPTAKIMCLLGLLLLSSGRAQDSPPSEHQIKAAFIFNFAKFVEWPREALPGPSLPMVIGILGDGSFGADFQQALANKVINDRPLLVKEFRQAADVTNCHILFISASVLNALGEKERREIMENLGRSNVLTIGEAPGFTEDGGMINFVMENNKIRFQINEPAAKKAKLKVSSKLLSLAVPSSR